MTNDKKELPIHALLDDAGPIPENADAGTLRSFLEGSRLSKAEQQRVLAFLTQPALRLIWANPPEANHDCVQVLEVRLPPVFRGLQPRLHVRFPLTLPVTMLPGNEPQGTGVLLGVIAGGREHWRQLPLQLENAAVDGRWRADLQFRLPADLRGAYLWKFRIDFLESWGHAELPRWFGADYTVNIGLVNGETTLEINAGDFSSVTMTAPERWNHIKINLTDNARLRESNALPDYAAWFRGAGGNDGNAAVRGVVIDTTIQHLHLPPSRSVLVVTPHVPSGVQQAGAAARTIRGAWPGVSTAKLTLKTVGGEAAARTLYLHTASELRLGRRKNYQEKNGGTHHNHIVVDFDESDFPGVDPDTLKKRRATISSANTTVLISDGQLTVRNTGTPGSEYPGMTRVSWKQDGKQQQEQLDEREDEKFFDLPKNPVTDLELLCGGFPGDKNLPGYRLDLTPIRAWDDTTSQAWDDPQTLQDQIGRLPKQARKVHDHGMDALLVVPRPPHLQQVPAQRQQHVLLLRQLWLGADGLPIDDPARVNLKQMAAVRLLTAARENNIGQVLLLQLLSDRHQLTVRSAADAVAMQVPAFGIVPLMDGDLLTLSANGRECWTGKFEVLPD